MPAVKAARSAVSRRSSAEASRVMARKNGTAESGSTTKKIAESEMSERVRSSATTVRG